jgi:hypothetical protein
MLSELVLMIAFVALLFSGGSYFVGKKGSRLVFQGIALVLFGLLAVQGSSIEDRYCFGIINQDLSNSSYFCVTDSVFESGFMWLFASLCLLQAVLFLVTVFQHMDVAEED